jgi:hypothetical protein
LGVLEVVKVAVADVFAGGAVVGEVVQFDDGGFEILDIVVVQREVALIIGGFANGFVGDLLANWVFVLEAVGGWGFHKLLMG